MFAGKTSLLRNHAHYTSFTWKQDNWDELEYDVPELSDIFCSPDYEPIKWCLECIKDRKQYFPDGDALYKLRLVSSDTLPLDTQYQFSHIESNYDHFNSHTFTEIGESVNLCYDELGKTSVTKTKFIKITVLEGELASAKVANLTPPSTSQINNFKTPLDMSANMSTAANSQVKEKELPSHIQSPKPPPTSALKDLDALLKDRRWEDLTFFIGNKRLKVHKAIVGARSPVLAAMLDEGTIIDELEIPDEDFDTMERLVHYMYTDQVDDIDVNTGELYLAACRFELLDLKDMCEDTLINCLTIENAAQTLVIVQQHSKELKTRVVNFIKRNFQEVSVTVGFQSAVTAHPQLFVEMLLTIHSAK